MKRVLFVLLWCALLFVPVRAEIDTGTWSAAVFEGKDYGDIERAQWGRKDCIWFTTDSGIGQLHLLTSQIRFFSFDSLKITQNQGLLAAADEKRAVYAGEVYLGEPLEMLLYDSSGWKKIVAPAYFFAITIDADGRIWAGNDSALYRYSKNEWKKFPLKSPGQGSEPTQLLEDDSGTIWFIDNNRRLYSFNGSDFNMPQQGDFTPVNLFKDSQGQVWVYAWGTGPDYLCVVDSNRLLPGLRIDSTMIDYFSMDSAGPEYNGLHEPKNKMWLSVISGTPAFFCAHGVVVPDKKGFMYYSDDRQDYTFISLRSVLTGNTCGNIPGRQDMKILYCRDSSTWIAYEIANPNIVKYKNGACFELPPLAISCFLEHTDGKVLAGTSNGLFFYNGSQWERVPGLENINIGSLIQDKTGKIWGTSGNYIFRQNDFNWELIDSSNSNIKAGIYGNTLEDNDGAIWVSTGGGAAKTTDGYHWTVYDSLMPWNCLKSMSKDQNGNIVLVYVTSCPNRAGGSMCSTMVKATFNGLNWHADTLENPLPRSIVLNGGFYDTRGDWWVYLWVGDTSSGALPGALYRYTDSKWIRYDQKNSPFPAAFVFAEAPPGNLWAVEWDKLYTFERHSLSAIALPYPSGLLNKSAFIVRSANGKNISVNYSIVKPGHVSLCLYSLQGKLIKTLAHGFHEKGSYKRNCRFGGAKGVYLMRLSDPDGVRVNKLIIR